MNLIFDSKKKIGLFVLSSALIIAGILVFYDPQAPKKSLADLKNEDGSTVEGFNLKKENEQIGILSSEDLSALLTGKKASENLTQKFADNLAKGFVDSNPSGIEEGKEIAVPDDQTLLTQAALDYQKEINSSDIFIKEKDLKISYNNSKENIYDYYVDYQDILNKYLGKINIIDNLNMFADTNNSNYLNSSLTYLESLIAELKNLSVPSDFSVLHQEAINLLIVNQNILSSLVKVDDDPLRASSSLLMLEEVSDKFLALDKNFIQALQDHGFNIQYSQ